ncbi:MAG: SGNH/GDSL hydrolase family protein [Ignavibacteriaceae bacterium]
MKNILLWICLLVILLNLPGYSQNKNLKEDWANLKRYTKANEKLGSQSAGENRVVFMGNSITESWAVIDSSFFADNKNFIDRGISGQTSSQMLLRFRQDVIDLNPDVVVILAGTNDIAENTGPISIKDIFGNIVSMVQLAEMNKIKVILSSVLPAYDFPWHHGLKPAEKIVKLNSMLKSYCEENNIKYVDYYSKMVDDRGGLDKRYTNDGVHPTIAGYKIMDSIIEQAIKNEPDKTN